jgi:hypothetical protein
MQQEKMKQGPPQRNLKLGDDLTMLMEYLRSRGMQFPQDQRMSTNVQDLRGIDGTNPDLKGLVELEASTQGLGLQELLMRWKERQGQPQWQGNNVPNIGDLLRPRSDQFSPR